MSISVSILLIAVFVAAVFYVIVAHRLAKIGTVRPNEPGRSRLPLLSGADGTGPLRTDEPGFRFVYMNSDGSVRDLSRAEQEMFEKQYEVDVRERPHVKARYDQRDGWRSLSGFIERDRVPPDVVIGPVDPDYVPARISMDFIRKMHESAGDTIIDTPDGFTVEKSPVNRAEGMRRYSEFYLAHKKEEEARAKPKN